MEHLGNYQLFTVYIMIRLRCLNKSLLCKKFLFLLLLLLLFYFTILYWFCHTSRMHGLPCICHGCTHVPHPEPPSHLPPHTIPLGHPSATAPSFLYPASNLDWRFVFSIIHIFGEGNGTPLQHSCLENPMDGGAWWAAIYGVAKSRTQLSDFPFTFHFPALEKEMATHSSVLAWRIPGTVEPGGLSSMGSHRVGHD